MVNFSTKSKSYWFSNNKYGMNDYKKFLEYFFNFIDDNNITNKIKVYDIQDVDEIYESKYINVLLCVENCNYWKHYKMINKYGNFGNENFKIYIYNHFNKIVKTDKYIVIPVIFLQVNYFINNYINIKPTKYIPFNDKKFCLQVSFSKNEQTRDIINKTLESLNKIGYVDNISKYKYLIHNKSCYHSNDLLNLFQSYKFILCFENSLSEGYITEKIFNVFFSRTIPIYFGPKDKDNYFNKNCYIDVCDNNIEKKLINLNNNEEEYNNVINTNKISNTDLYDKKDVAKYLHLLNV